MIDMTTIQKCINSHINHSHNALQWMGQYFSLWWLRSCVHSMMYPTGEQRTFMNTHNSQLSPTVWKMWAWPIINRWGVLAGVFSDEPFMSFKRDLPCVFKPPQHAGCAWGLTRYWFSYWSTVTAFNTPGISWGHQNHWSAALYPINGIICVWWLL